MKLRQHRGGFQESMETTIEIEPTKAALLQAITNSDMRGLPLDLTEDQVTVEPYTFGPYQSSHDPRNGWNTHIVTLQGWGVFGFTDGPLTASEDPIDKGSPETVEGTATCYYGVATIGTLSPEEARRKRPGMYKMTGDPQEEVPFATSPFDDERRPPEIARDHTVMHHTVNGKGAVGRIK
jgi:hypothetical protein